MSGIEPFQEDASTDSNNINNNIPGISVTSNVVGGIIFVLLLLIVVLTSALVLGLYCTWKRNKRQSSGRGCESVAQITTMVEKDVDGYSFTENKSYPRFIHASTTVTRGNEYGDSRSAADPPYAVPMFEAHPEGYDKQMLGEVVLPDTNEDHDYEVI